MMPSPPILADEALVGGFSGDPAQNGAFFPEMEIALDHAGLDTPGSGSPWQLMEAAAGEDQQGANEPLAAPVTTSPMPLLVALFQRVHAVIHLPIAGAGDGKPDAAVPMSPDECQAEGIAPSLAPQLSPHCPRTADDRPARLIEEDLCPARSAIAPAVVGPAAPPIESVPPPALTRLGLPAADESVPGATPSEGSSGAVSEPLSGQLELPVWAG